MSPMSPFFKMGIFFHRLLLSLMKSMYVQCKCMCWMYISIIINLHTYMGMSRATLVSPTYHLHTLPPTARYVSFYCKVHTNIWVWEYIFTVEYKYLNMRVGTYFFHNLKQLVNCSNQYNQGLTIKNGNKIYIVT